MHTDALTKALALAGPGFDVCLCAVMLARKRWQQFPALLLLVALDTIFGLALFWTDPSGHSVAYFRLYLMFDVASFVLQLVLLFEIAKDVLKPTGIWTRDALKPLLITSSVGAAVALCATWLLQPTGVHHLQALELRADVFSSLLTCELVVSMMLSAKEVGLPWRSHAMAVGQGLMFWSLVAATDLGIVAYLGIHSPYVLPIYTIRSVNYFIVVTYWTVSLWRNEPARKPISPALQKYVLALHERVHYDFGKVGH